jgi:polygalacturonase
MAARELLLLLVVVALTGARSVEIFNVRHYGAVGDNTTCDTMSVRAAAKALAMAGTCRTIVPYYYSTIVGISRDLIAGISTG